MEKSSPLKDTQPHFYSLLDAYASTPTNLVIDLFIFSVVCIALIQVVYMFLVGSFPFKPFLPEVLGWIGTAFLTVRLCIQANK